MTESKDEPTRTESATPEGHDETGPIMSPSPQPAFGPGPDDRGSRRDGGPAAGWESEQPTQVGVLDRPVDDVPLRARLSRPGTARSTRILLLVLGAIVFLAIGLFVGRASAPATGPGSVRPVPGSRTGTRCCPWPA